MANRGKSRHMTGLAAPKYFGIYRKHQRYVLKPNPGRHSLDRCVPLLLAVKKLGAAQGSVEVSSIIRNGSVLVNGRGIREVKYPVGLNDVIEFKGTGQYCIIGIEKHGRITFEELKKADYENQLFRVIGKYKTEKGQIMIRLHDGSNAKGNKDVKVNDSVIIDSKRSVKMRVPLQVGAQCFVISGVHVGTKGSISSIKEGTEKREASAVIKPSSGDEFETIVRNIMVTG
ncbi:MAG: hypothetical protein LVQ95_02190 [Candidatus Micrarchaeales archaeon]|nr:hypothetical protein [Candidatus Micrarchaeales archaeon]